MNRFPRNDTGSDTLNSPSLYVFNVTFTVYRVSKWVKDSPDEAISNGHVKDSSRPFGLSTFNNTSTFTEENNTYVVFFQVKSNALCSIFKLYNFSVLNVFKAVNPCYTVSYFDNDSRFIKVYRGFKFLNLFSYQF